MEVGYQARQILRISFLSLDLKFLPMRTDRCLYEDDNCPSNSPQIPHTPLRPFHSSTQLLYQSEPIMALS